MSDQEDLKRPALGTTPVGEILGGLAVIGVAKLCDWIDSLGQHEENDQ